MPQNQKKKLTPPEFVAVLQRDLSGRPLEGVTVGRDGWVNFCFGDRTLCLKTENFDTFKIRKLPLN